MSRSVAWRSVVRSLARGQHVESALQLIAVDEEVAAAADWLPNHEGEVLRVSIGQVFVDRYETTGRLQRNYAAAFFQRHQTVHQRAAFHANDGPGAFAGSEDRGHVVPHGVDDSKATACSQFLRELEFIDENASRTMAAAEDENARAIAAVHGG
jgi:hypothetical protein